MNQKICPITDELLKKSREAALAAVQIFNNPNITFKSESYVVLMIIAWTYLLHAFYRSKGIEYRYFKKQDEKIIFKETKNGAYKHWELECCLNNKESPIDKDAANNLKFLIGLRHEIEHQMTTRIDDLLSARFQACCLNYNEYIKRIFGDGFAIEKHLSFSLQFSTISSEQKKMLEEYPDLPQSIHSYIKSFDIELSDQEFNSPRYAYRLFFAPKLASQKGQADRVIEFIKSDSPLADAVNKERFVIKEMEKKKYRPGDIVNLMREERYVKFSMHHHTFLWKELYPDADKPEKGFGAVVAGKQWLWYENWVEKVRQHCQENREKYCK